MHRCSAGRGRQMIEVDDLSRKEVICSHRNSFITYMKPCTVVARMATIYMYYVWRTVCNTTRSSWFVTDAVELVMNKI